MYKYPTNIPPQKRLKWLQARQAELLATCERLLDLQMDGKSTERDEAAYKTTRAELEKAAAEEKRLRAERPPINPASLSRLDPNTGEVLRRTAAALPQGSLRAGLDRMFAGVEPLADPASDAEARQLVDEVLSAALSGATFHAATGTTTQDGALVVPGQMASRWLDTALQHESVIAQLCRFEPFPVEGNSWAFPAFDDEDESGDAEAGLVAGWTPEAGGLSGQKPALRQFEAHLNKLAVLVRLSSEQVDDSISSYARELDRRITRALGKKLDSTIISGTGAGQPLGVLNAAATITVTKESGQTAATIVLDNVLKMWSRLLPSAAENATWHTSTLPQLLQMAVTVGTGGSVVPWGFVPDGMGGYTLLGRPVVVTSRLSQLGTVGDVIVGDFSKYLLTVKGQVALARSQHVYFDSDEVAIRGRIRADGGVTLKGPVTPQSGSDTLSPFVTLETRS